MALVPDQKFSTFSVGGDLTLGDIVVGLRGGINTQFTWTPPAAVDTVTGTQYQVLVNNSFGTPVTGDIVLTLPQNIATSSSPTFAGLTLASPLDGASGGTGVANTGLTINLGSATTGYLLTSDSSGNATWQAPGYLTGAVLLSPSGDQTITSNNLILELGNYYSGTAAGGVQGTFRAYPATANTGYFQLAANLNSGAFGVTLTNQPFGQTTDIYFPDPGASSAVVAYANTPSSGYVLLNPSADQSIIANNLYLTNGGFISGGILGPQGALGAGNIQTIGLSGVNGSFIASSYYTGGSGSAPTYWTYKSRAAAVGSFAAVQAGDQLGRWEAYADDGTQFSRAGAMVLTAAGSISSGIVPGVWTISTANASGTLLPALVIDQTQLVTAQILASNTTIAASGTITGQGVISGLAAGSASNYFESFSQTTNLGSLLVRSNNNSGNFASTLTNLATSAARTWSLPDASGTIALVGSSIVSIQGTANEVLVNGASGSPVSGTAIILTTPQPIGTSNTPVFAGVTLGQLNDSNGATALLITPTASAVNYINLTNAATTVAPSIAAAGTDTNISLGLFSKGTGTVGLISAATTNQFAFLAGGSATSSIFNMPTSAGPYVFTFPSTSGTVALTSGIPSLGDFAFSGDTMSTVTTNADMTLQPNGTGKIFLNTSYTLANSNGVYIGPMTTDFENQHMILNLSAISSNLPVRGYCFSNGGAGQSFTLTGVRSRSTIPGTRGVVTAGDTLMQFIAAGDNGSNDAFAAQIVFKCAATPGSTTPGSMIFSTSSTVSTNLVALTIDQNQVATFNNAIVSANGINFGGSTLANYVTAGTFTPVLTFSSPGDLSVAYSVQGGNYTRIGNVVTAQIQIVATPTYTTASGVVEVTGLPFATNATASYELSASLLSFGFAFPATATALFVYAGPSSSILSVYGVTPAGGNPQVGITQFTSGSPMQMHATFSYLV